MWFVTWWCCSIHLLTIHHTIHQMRVNEWILVHHNQKRLRKITVDFKVKHSISIEVAKSTNYHCLPKRHPEINEKQNYSLRIKRHVVAMYMATQLALSEVQYCQISTAAAMLLRSVCSTAKQQIRSFVTPWLCWLLNYGLGLTFWLLALGKEEKNGMAISCHIAAGASVQLSCLPAM